MHLYNKIEQYLNRVARCLPCKVSAAKYNDKNYDSLIVVSCWINLPEELHIYFEEQSTIDKSFEFQVSLVECPKVAGKRLVYSPVGKLNEYDDVRSFHEAAAQGIARARAAGSKNPVLMLPCCKLFEKAGLVALLGALSYLYVPLQLREDVPSRKKILDSLGVDSSSTTINVNEIIELACLLESGLHVCRDIAGPDPERMTAKRVQEYVEQTFKGSSVAVKVVDNEEVLKKEYPLFAAVNRAASVVERHKGRILYLEYKPEGPISETIFLVGKGVIFDSGGSNLKPMMFMTGMSRDKCGAATVAGFFQICAVVKPSSVRIVGAMPLVRNAIGEDAYVPDEIITARSGMRVRVENTDAEGRFIMADPLCKLKDEAMTCPNPHLYTIATLTGHAKRVVGQYTAVCENSVARKEECAKKLSEIAAMYGTPLEVSRLRREDVELSGGIAKGVDMGQIGGPLRGHQWATGFLMSASGLNKCGLDSKTPLKYTHMDNAGSSGNYPGDPTGDPLIALTMTYLIR